MARHVVLLRGINIGSSNRIAMAELRAALGEAGFEDVKTYLASGNVVLTSRAQPDTVAREVAQVVEDRFGLQIPVVTRTHAELAAVVERNPLADVATQPKRYQVSFLSDELAPEVVAELEAAAAPGERVVAIGREAYAWHPDGIARSPLWEKLAGKKLGVTATARNWATVEALLALAAE